MNLKTKIRILFVLCLLLVPQPSDAGGSKPQPVAMAPVERLSFKAISFTPPQAQRLVMDNGITLYILEDHELPLVNVSVVFRTGSAYDPAGNANVK